jgi:hypothetical protein
MKRSRARAFEPVDELLIVAGAEGGNNDRLGFTAREQRLTRVCAAGCQPGSIGRTVDRSRPSMRTPVVDDGAAHDVLFGCLEAVSEQDVCSAGIGVFRGSDRCVTFSLPQRRGPALLLSGDREGDLEIVANGFLDLCLVLLLRSA